MSVESGAWRMDAGLTPITSDAWSSEFPGLESAIRKLFDGGIVNPSEGRPALHPMLRAPDDQSPPGFAEARHRMLDVAGALHEGRTPVRVLLHVGIGGSDLGPRLVTDALDPDDSAVEVHWLSTLDDQGLDRLLGRLDPSTTGMVVASKSFGTRETRLQADAIRGWLGQDWAKRSWAATSRVDRAVEWGLSEAAVLPFDEAIGGRFSLWSSVGVSAAARIGRSRFEQLLAGAARADGQVQSDPAGSLAGRIALAIDQLVRVHGFSTLGVVSYAPGLRRLADFLQQLVMESLGKRVTPGGSDTMAPTSPLIFGGAGTDLQHALYQAIHQGTTRHPMLLIGEAPNGGDPHGFRVEQMSNLLGQARTLAFGHDDADPQRVLPGGNPVLTMLARRLDAHALGDLLAHWEHAVYLLGHRWNVNPFDQWGVEEGKVQADAFRAAIESDERPPDERFGPVLSWLAGKTSTG